MQRISSHHITMARSCLRVQRRKRAGRGLFEGGLVNMTLWLRASGNGCEAECGSGCRLLNASMMVMVACCVSSRALLVDGRRSEENFPEPQYRRSPSISVNPVECEVPFQKKAQRSKITLVLRTSQYQLTTNGPRDPISRPLSRAERMPLIMTPGTYRTCLLFPQLRVMKGLVHSRQISPTRVRIFRGRNRRHNPSTWDYVTKVYQFVGIVVCTRVLLCAEVHQAVVKSYVILGAVVNGSTEE